MPQAPLIVALLTLVVTLAACGAPAPPVPPPTSAPPAPARYPADVLNLNNWYLTLPTGTAGAPENVYPPELKAGSNVQSNPQRGDAPDAMGEVVIHSLGVEHSV